MPYELQGKLRFIGRCETGRVYEQVMVIHDPETGEERSWTRATTIANTLADRFGLE